MEKAIAEAVCCKSRPGEARVRITADLQMLGKESSPSIIGSSVAAATAIRSDSASEVFDKGHHLATIAIDLAGTGSGKRSGTFGMRRHCQGLRELATCSHAFTDVAGS